MESVLADNLAWLLSCIIVIYLGTVSIRLEQIYHIVSQFSELELSANYLRHKYRSFTLQSHVGQYCIIAPRDKNDVYENVA